MKLRELNELLSQYEKIYGDIEIEFDSYDHAGLTISNEESLKISFKSIEDTKELNMITLLKIELS